MLETELSPWFENASMVELLPHTWQSRFKKRHEFKHYWLRICTEGEWGTTNIKVSIAKVFLCKFSEWMDIYADTVVTTVFGE